MSQSSKTAPFDVKNSSALCSSLKDNTDSSHMIKLFQKIKIIWVLQLFEKKFNTELMVYTTR